MKTGYENARSRERRHDSTLPTKTGHRGMIESREENWTDCEKHQEDPLSSLSRFLNGISLERSLHDRTSQMTPPQPFVFGKSYPDGDRLKTSPFDSENAVYYDG